jgi:hypothetical protein
MAVSVTDLKRIFPGNSEMARRMRSFDWFGSKLGSPEDWPEALKTSIRITLTSRHPMFVWWGPQLLSGLAASKLLSAQPVATFILSFDARKIVHQSRGLSSMSHRRVPHPPPDAGLQHARVLRAGVIGRWVGSAVAQPFVAANSSLSHRPKVQ